MASSLEIAGRSLDELALPYTVDVNRFTGAAMVRVPLPTTSGRGGFGPDLSLSYGSGGWNSAFGVGWQLEGLPSVTVDLSGGTPRYGDDPVYAYAGRRLVPTQVQVGDSWEIRPDEVHDGHRVRHYRAQDESAFTRYERWISFEDGGVHWRVRPGDGSVTILGRVDDGSTRITDPEDGSRVYSWLIESRFDALGNAMRVEYEVEDGAGVSGQNSFEVHRLRKASGFSQRYPKRVQYGNLVPFSSSNFEVAGNRWLFEVVFDYGDHDDAEPQPAADRTWGARPDPYSTYRPGFEVRTYRLCRRVLLFHRFDDPVLVQSIELLHNLDAAGTTLDRLTLTGHRRDAGMHTSRALPPLVFQYAEPQVGREFRAPEETGLENLPVGVSGRHYQWFDLYGEGLPGVLTETDDAWLFKPNAGGGRFGAQQRVAERPRHLVGGHTLGDFDRDGNPNLVVLHGRHAGYCTFDRETESWSGFRPFPSTPNVTISGRIAWVDTNGDGRPDLVAAKQDRLTIYESLGAEGFGAPVEVSLPSGEIGAVPTVQQNSSLDLFFLDMTGDGSQDLVRLRNGRVEYWPQLGHGRFGEGVVMEGAPRFDFEEEFDASRIRFVDLDGSGTNDLVYLGRGEIRTWINASGNRFVEGPVLEGVPYIDNLSQASVLDFLGDGTPCLVWSTPLPGAAEGPLQYLPLTSGTRPRLLLSVSNSLGAENHLSYGSSSRHYLRDRAAGRPWTTKLPTHTIVVDEKRTVDLIAQTELTLRFAFRDGYFDSETRRFAGFGRVDVVDMPRAVVNEASPPGMLSRLFFHTGSLRAGRAAADLYTGDPDHARVAPPEIENLDEVDGDEYLGAYWSLAGRPLRVETYEIGPLGEAAPDPIETVEHGYRIRRLQPGRGDHGAAFFTHEVETLTHTYEQFSDDPRVLHELTLEVDTYGRSRVDCSVAYPRRGTLSVASQGTAIVKVGRDRFEHRDEPDDLLLGVEIENEEFEVTGLSIPARGQVLLRSALLGELESALASPLSHHEDRTPGKVEATRTDWARTLYWNDTETSALPLGSFGRRALVHHDEEACFSTEFAQTHLDDAVGSAEFSGAFYVLAEGHWWKSGETHRYLGAAGFFRLEAYERDDGATSLMVYDEPYFLHPVESVDPLGNRVLAELDYHLLVPERITDPNGSTHEARYDPLGVISVQTRFGTIVDDAGVDQPYGQAPLADHASQPLDDTGAVLANPAAFLQGAESLTAYDLDWAGHGSPPRSVTLVRETLHRDGLGAPQPAGRVQVTVSYVDGFGRALQSKLRVDPGPAIQRDAGGQVEVDAEGAPLLADTAERWLVSGFESHDARQQVVRTFEPFYSPTVEFEDDAALRSHGAATTTHRDARGRVVRLEMPDGTRAGVSYEAWRTIRHDPNDLVNESPWTITRESLPLSDPERDALEKSRAHAATPAVTHFDPLGRDVLEVEDVGSGTNLRVEIRRDSDGEMIEMIDPRGLSAVRRVLDLQGRVVAEDSMDAGRSTTFSDAFDRPLETWDARGVHLVTTFDLLDRVVQVHAGGTTGLDHIVQTLQYGDDGSVAEPERRNLRGRVVRHRDSAGQLEYGAYTPFSDPLVTTRRIRDAYGEEVDWSTPASVGLDATGHESSARYDGMHRAVGLSAPDGIARTFVYGADGGLQELRISSADGQIVEQVILEEAERNARGQRERVLCGNGVEIRADYNADNFRLRRLSSTGPVPGAAGTRTLQDITYAYDAFGNVTFQRDAAQAAGSVLAGLTVGPECDYTYDGLYRLKRATGRVHQALLRQPGPFQHSHHLALNNGAAVERYTRTFVHDASGNLTRIRHVGTSQTWNQDLWVASDSNRSVPAFDSGGLPVSNPEGAFDASGNCRRLDHLRQMDWDYRHRLAKAVLVERTDGRPDDAEYYVYDGSGRRVRKVFERVTAAGVERVETLYFDGCEIHRVLLNSAEVLRRSTTRLSDGGVLLAILHRWQRDDLARETDAVAKVDLRYQLANHLGSVGFEVDPTGRVIGYEEYFPYGGTAFVAGDVQREIALKTRRHAGKERDATGLYYYEYRYYAPWIGNWLSPDPAGLVDGPNLYVFVRNNPITLVDLDGLQSSGASGQLKLLDTVPSHYNETQALRHFNSSRGLELGIYATDLRKSGNQWIIEDSIKINPRVFNKHGATLPLETIALLSIVPNILDESPGLKGLEEAGGFGDPDVDASKEDKTPSGGEDPSAKGSTTDGDPDADSNAQKGGSTDTDLEPADKSPGTEGDGPGLGRQGKGPGGGGDSDKTGKDGKSEGDGGQGPGGAGSGSTESGKTGGSGNTPGGSGTGSIHGSVTGSQTDSPNGEENGTGAAGTNGSGSGQRGGRKGGSDEGKLGGSLEGSENGNSTSPDALRIPPPGGSEPAPAGATPNGTDTSGRQDGASADQTQGGGSAQQPGGQEGGSKKGEANANGGGSGQERTTMDKIVGVAGYWHLEFGDKSKGQSGGIPGSMGSWNLGAVGQVAFLAQTVVDVVLTVVSFGGLAALKTGIKLAVKGIMSVGRRLAAKAAQVLTKQFWRKAGQRVARTFTRARRFFWDNRSFRELSGEYWRRRGPANGRSLHHWLLPQRSANAGLGRFIPRGIRNAGWNLINLPAMRGVFHRSLGLNEWMGFARNWGRRHARRAAAVENSIRVGIPVLGGGAAYGGYKLGEEINDRIRDDE